MPSPAGVHFNDVDRLEPLFALGHLELHLLAFHQALVAVPLDGGVVDEEVVAAGSADKAVAPASLNHLTVPVSFMVLLFAKDMVGSPPCFSVLRFHSLTLALALLTPRR